MTQNTETSYFCLNSALYHYSNNNYGRVFPLLMTVFELQPELRELYKPQFIYSLREWGSKLKRRNRLYDLRRCYTDAFKYFPTDPEIIKDYIVHLMKLDNTEDEMNMLEFIKEMEEKGLVYEKIINWIKLELVMRWHYRMVNDYERNMAYYKALLSYNNNYSNKLKVIDIGAGTGLLSLFASNSPDVGTIYAIESEEILAEITKYNVIENCLKNIQVINKFSTDLNENDINGKADLVVTEIFDAALFGEKCLTTLTHAWKELLNKNAKIIPNSADVFIVGIQSEELLKKVRVLSDIPLLKDFILIGRNNEPYEVENLKLIEYKEITEVKKILTVDFCSLNQLENLLKGETIEVKLKCVLNGEINSFAIWFDLNLDENIKISTNPKMDNVKCWEQALFYIDFPKVNQKNDEINLIFSCLDNRVTLKYLNEDFCSKQEHFLVHPDIITFLNDTPLIKTIINLSQKYLNLNLKVLDNFNFPLFGLILAQNNSESYFIITENFPKVIDEIIYTNNITSNVHYLSEDVTIDFMMFDVILFDVISTNGTLDCDVYTLLWTCNSAGKKVFPSRIKLVCEVIESDYLVYCSRANDDNSFAFKIANHLNMFAINEHWMFDLKTPYKKLTKKLELDILQDDTEPLISEHLVQIVQKGRTHGILYWFELYFGDDDLKINTLESSYYKKACFLLQNNDIVYENNYIKIAVRQHKGNLKIFSSDIVQKEVIVL